MKIIITNTVVLNGGDAAILEAVIYLLRKAFGDQIEFIIYDNNPKVASQYYPHLKFRKTLFFSSFFSEKKYVRRLLKFINPIRFYIALYFFSSPLDFIAKPLLAREEYQDLIEYKDADLIVSTGGTYLVENYSLVHRIFDYNISLWLGRPLVFFTQSLGPFSRLANRKAFKRIFGKSVLILLRDNKSLEHIQALGLENVKAHVTADAVFALTDISDIVSNLEAVEEDKLFSNFPLKVAISVRDWKHFKTIDPTLGREKYLEAMRALSIHLVETYNARITYVSTCQGIVEYEDDSEVALEIFDKLPDSIRKHVIINRSFHSRRELIDMIKQNHMVVSTRMHMAILSLCAGIPVLPIAYEFKTQELFKRFKQEKFVHDIENICPESIIKSVDYFIESLLGIKKSLNFLLRQEYERSLEASEIVRRAFEEWKNEVL